LIGWRRRYLIDSSRKEELLQELVEQNATIISKLDDIVAGVTEINNELNWVGDLSLAKMVVEKLDAIESAISALGS
jgi:hypothetical protein